jgi:hypothetical protein
LLVIALAFVFVVIGIVFLFALPWVGVPIALVGLALAVLWMAGFARQAIRGRTPTDHTPREDA